MSKAFIFPTSHLPEVKRPEDEEEDDVQPMPRSGGVRAFSHLPQRAPVRQTDPAPRRPSASADLPSWATEPEADTAPTPEPDADTDSENDNGPNKSEESRPWYMPRISAEDLPSQDHPEDANAPAPSSLLDDEPPPDRSTSTTRDNGFTPSPQDLRDAFHSSAPDSPAGQAPAQGNRPALQGGRLFEQRSAPESFLMQQMGKAASGPPPQQRLQESQQTLAAQQQPVRGPTPPANGNNPAALSQPASPYQGQAPEKRDEGREASPRNNPEVKASSSSPESCGSKGDLYDIPDAKIISLTAAEIFKKNQDEGGIALTTRLEGYIGDKIEATATVKKDANGKYVGHVCIPRIYTYTPTSYIARPQLRWTSGKPGADKADITAKTVADFTEHEKAHIKVDQSVGRRISKYYLENVFKIKTKPYATEEEAKKKVRSMEHMFFLECNRAFTKMRTTFNDKHLPANIRPYQGGSGTEWYEPHPDWFTSLGLDDMIQNAPVNVPLPTDR